MSQRRTIPGPLIAALSNLIASRESQATLNNLFIGAGAPGDPPPGSKLARSLAWLRITDSDPSCADPLGVAGKLCAKYLDAPDDSWPGPSPEKIAQLEQLHKCIADSGLHYGRGGILSSSGGLPSKSLHDFIRAYDLTAVEREFERAVRNVDSNPRDAVSAASNLLEDIFRLFLEARGGELPRKQDLQSLWEPARKALGFDPSCVEDEDVKQILSSLISSVKGIGSLRTHASSAHGHATNGYPLEPRHARLAVNAAHTVGMFVLETWKAPHGL